MCLFIGPVASVSKTKILVAPLPGGSRQLTVYQNDVEGGAKNAMVLPVPKGDVELFDISSTYRGDIWDDCEGYFPPDQASFGWGGGFSSSSGAAAPLPVQMSMRA